MFICFLFHLSMFSSFQQLVESSSNSFVRPWDLIGKAAGAQLAAAHAAAQAASQRNDDRSNDDEEDDEGNFI